MTERADPGSASTPDTGNVDVDGALARMSDLDTLPATEHAEVYEEVHQRLADTLDRRDER